MKYDLKNNTDVQDLMFKVNKAIEGEYNVEFKKVRLKRGVRQNAYLHVCISLYGVFGGLTIDEAKQLLKSMRLDLFEYENKGHIFKRGTSDLDTKETTDFIEFIRNSASMQYGEYIPTPEDYIQSQIYWDRMIKQNQNYLNA